MTLHPTFAGILSAWQSAPQSRQVARTIEPLPLKNHDNQSGTSHAIAVGMSNLRTKLIEYHGNNRATFECPAGHRFRSSVMPKSPLGKLPSEEISARFAAYWQRTGVRMDCPKCKALLRSERERNAR